MLWIYLVTFLWISMLINEPKFEILILSHMFQTCFEIRSIHSRSVTIVFEHPFSLYPFFYAIPSFFSLEFHYRYLRSPVYHVLWVQSTIQSFVFDRGSVFGGISQLQISRLTLAHLIEFIYLLVRGNLGTVCTS